MLKMRKNVAVATCLGVKVPYIATALSHCHHHPISHITLIITSHFYPLFSLFSPIFTFNLTVLLVFAVLS